MAIALSMSSLPSAILLNLCCWSFSACSEGQGDGEVEVQISEKGGRSFEAVRKATNCCPGVLIFHAFSESCSLSTSTCSCTCGCRSDVLTCIQPNPRRPRQAVDDADFIPLLQLPDPQATQPFPTRSQHRLFPMSSRATLGSAVAYKAEASGAILAIVSTTFVSSIRAFLFA